MNKDMRFIKTFRKKKTKNVIQVAQVTHTDTATVTKIFHVIDTRSFRHFLEIF